MASRATITASGPAWTSTGRRDGLRGTERQPPARLHSHAKNKCGGHAARLTREAHRRLSTHKSRCSHGWWHKRSKGVQAPAVEEASTPVTPAQEMPLQVGESQAPLVQVAWPDGVYPVAHSKVTLAPLAVLAPTAALMLLVVKAEAQFG